jgi:hypothetical protein
MIAPRRDCRADNPRPSDGQSNDPTETLGGAMLFLEVLPAFTVYVVALGTVTLIAGHTQTGQPLFPYLWRATVASTAGVLVADGILWAIVVTAGSILTATYVPAQLQQAVGILEPLGPILQPLPASLIGAIVGICVGLGWARRAGPSGS